MNSGGSVYPQYNYTKHNGFAVRCVAKDSYTINYDANSGTGTMNPTKAYIDFATALSANAFTKDGYAFAGWSTDPNATTATYNNNESVTNLTTAGNSVTLYAIWAPISGAMQETSCSNLTAGATSYLTDSRDGQVYSVYRWGSSAPSGMANYCIMTKDLSLGYTTGGSITRGSNLALTANDSAAAATIIARTSISDWSSSDTDSNNQYIIGPQSGYEIYTSHSYYSYGAAQKVCPKGWRLPTNSEYSNIISFMGGSSTTSSTNIRSAPYNFVYGGNYNNFASGGFDSAGSYGDYWSSTQSGGNGYYLGFDSSSLYTLSRRKNIGRSVRCVAQ